MYLLSTSLRVGGRCTELQKGNTLNNNIFRVCNELSLRFYNHVRTFNSINTIMFYALINEFVIGAAWQLVRDGINVCNLLPEGVDSFLYFRIFKKPVLSKCFS